MWIICTSLARYMLGYVDGVNTLFRFEWSNHIIAHDGIRRTIFTRFNIEIQSN